MSVLWNIYLLQHNFYSLNCQIHATNSYFIPAVNTLLMIINTPITALLLHYTFHTLIHSFIFIPLYDNSKSRSVDKVRQTVLYLWVWVYIGWNWIGLSSNRRCICVSLIFINHILPEITTTSPHVHTIGEDRNYILILKTFNVVWSAACKYTRTRQSLAVNQTFLKKVLPLNLVCKVLQCVNSRVISVRNCFRSKKNRKNGKLCDYVSVDCVSHWNQVYPLGKWWILLS